MNLLKFAKKCFCGDKNKLFTPLWFVSILELKNYIYGTWDKIIVRVLEDMKISIGHVKRSAVLACKWWYGTINYTVEKVNVCIQILIIILDYHPIEVNKKVLGLLLGSLT